MTETVPARKANTIALLAELERAGTVIAPSVSEADLSSWMNHYYRRKAAA